MVGSTFSVRWSALDILLPISNPFASAVLGASLIGMSLLTVSCGDFQDPASGSSAGTTQISTQGTEFTNPSSTHASQQIPAGQDGQTAERPLPVGGNSGDSPISPTTPSSSGTPGAPSSETVPALRSITFAWDPSQGALGYKVYLIATSTLGQRIIDTGPATQLAVPLQVGESYAFTVTAYNASGESPQPPFVYFNVS